MKLQILVSAVDKDGRKLAERMKLPAEAILVIQGKENKYDQWERPEGRVRCYCFAERGVGLSRNNALLRADGDLCLFSDEDIVYRPDAAGTVLRAFEEHPGADMLLFNVKVHPDRRTYWTQRFHRRFWLQADGRLATRLVDHAHRLHERIAIEHLSMNGQRIGARSSEPGNLLGRGKMWGEGAMGFGQAGKLLFSGIRDGRKEF